MLNIPSRKRSFGSTWREDGSVRQFKIMINPKGDPLSYWWGSDVFTVERFAPRGLYMLEEARAFVELRAACFAIGGDNLGSDVINIPMRVSIMSGKGRIRRKIPIADFAPGRVTTNSDFRRGGESDMGHGIFGKVTNMGLPRGRFIPCELDPWAEGYRWVGHAFGQFRQ